MYRLRKNHIKPNFEILQLNIKLQIPEMFKVQIRFSNYLKQNEMLIS